MSTEQFSLKGRTALVTGSSTGLGKRMAMALARAGAKVAMNYFNNEERAAKTFAEFEATGAEGAMIRADVTDEADVNRLVAEDSAEASRQPLFTRAPIHPLLSSASSSSSSSSASSNSCAVISLLCF